MSESGGIDRPVDGRAARWAGQREKRRAEIVAAALAAIRVHGPAVSTEQIAEHAGIARPQLYRHFDGAEDLYGEIARGAADLLWRSMSEVLTNPAGTPRGIITSVVRTFVLWMIDNQPLYQYVVSSSVDPSSSRGQAAIAVRGDISGLVRDLLVAYLTALGRDSETADPLAFGLVGLVESATQRWLAQPGNLGRDELIDELVAWVWGLLDTALRARGIALDPDIPLPDLMNPDQTL